MTTNRLLLASTSPYRRELLARLGLEFETAAPNVDETPHPGETPSALASRLARAKAERVAADLRGPARLVIASDQVADLDGEPLGKPGNRDANIDQLLRCSGRQVTFQTALTVLDSASGRAIDHLEPFTVHFRRLARPAVTRYVELEQPFDAAGGFYCEGLGIVLFEALQGRDPNALIGLPLIALVDALTDFGVDVLQPAQLRPDAPA